MVIDFLAYGEIGGVISTNYRDKIRDLRNRLSWKNNPDAPFLPIPDSQMTEYLAVIEKQRYDNTMNA